MQDHLYLILTGVIAIVVLFLSGCGQTRVEGTVTFPDGTPLTSGKVVFENATNTYIAPIHEDGSFRMGTLKEGTGLPTGKYNVAITGAVILPSPGTLTKPTKTPATNKPKKPNTTSKKNQNQNQKLEVTHLVAEKFRSTKTSGIEYDIQKNTSDIKIIVEKP
ncbi:MAG: hypothetical protein LBP59_02555 [Planctomycetaceae bacterium]|jgi:hypothetical protein|nr:hypothetical protein [Planctomycetaceae bacterium]